MTAGTIETPPATHVRAAVERLAERRRTAAELRAAMQQLHATFEATHAGAIAALRQAQADEQQAETELRQLAVAHGQSTGERKPAPGVEMIVKQELDYRPDAAFAWARETGMALMLDKRAFEKIAGATPIACVTVLQVPAVRISTDLDRALAAVTP